MVQPNTGGPSGWVLGFKIELFALAWLVQSAVSVPAERSGSFGVRCRCFLERAFPFCMAGAWRCERPSRAQQAIGLGGGYYL